ncbi:ankyrin repeat-containing domain protein [Podospora aff. communis PSN243]|uniref:Ankyrin repeat-containing domain protein n=1 Tax=Podospora aff. communis PSN243 TaxID=3040156 RepID=A0AAV9GAB2_9PEZI|nr:ankyrin repeat-containing domain protein [Podospora aff. communis PSN243]
MEAALGVIGATDVAIRASSKLWALSREWRDAPADLHNLRDDVTRAERFFGEIQQHVNTAQLEYEAAPPPRYASRLTRSPLREKGRSGLYSTNSELGDLLETGGVILRRIEDIVDSLSVPVGGGGGSVRREDFGEMSKRRKVQWLLQAKKVAKLRKELAQMRAGVCQLLISQNAFVSADISSSVQWSQDEVMSRIDSLSTSFEASQDKMLTRIETRMQQMEERIMLMGVRNHQATMEFVSQRTAIVGSQPQSPLPGISTGDTPRRISFCDAGCTCSCHHPTKYSWKMALLPSMVGIAAVAYTNWSSTLCSNPECREAQKGRVGRDISVKYQLPDWLARASISAFFSTDLNGSPQMNIRVYHRRPWDDASPGNLILRGKAEDMKDRLRKREISVFDLFITTTSATHPALWLAYVYGIETNNYEKVKILLQAGADPFQRSGFTSGYTVVSAAFERIVADPTSSQDLAAIFPIQQYIDESEFSPLHLAVLEITHVDIPTLLLDPSIISQIDAPAAEGFTPLHLAALKGNAPAARALIRSGANLEARTANKGTTPLYYAARFNRLPIVAALVAAGADVNARDNDGVQAIHGAAICSTGDTSPILSILLDHGADVHSRSNDGASAIHYVLSRGTEGALRCLLKYGADVNSRRKNGTPAIFQVVYTNKPGMARVVLDHHGGVDLGVVRESGGDNVLHAIAGYGGVEMMRVFIGRRGFGGVRVGLRDGRGRTPLGVLNERKGVGEEVRGVFGELLEWVEGCNCQCVVGGEGESEDEFFDALDGGEAAPSGGS